MNDGIYHVSFSSSAGIGGEGLVVLRSGAANGGDHGYLYQGSLIESGGLLTGHLRVKRWNPAVVSVFGAINEFQLELTGPRDTTNGFRVNGNVTGQPNQKITIVGKFLSGLA